MQTFDNNLEPPKTLRATTAVSLLHVCVAEMPGANFAFVCVCVLRPPRRCLPSAAHPRAREDPPAVSQGEEEAGQTVAAPPGTQCFTQCTHLTGF